MAVTEEALAAREGGTYEDLAAQLQDAIAYEGMTVTTNADKTAVMAVRTWYDKNTGEANGESVMFYVRQ